MPLQPLARGLVVWANVTQGFLAPPHILCNPQIDPPIFASWFNNICFHQMLPISLPCSSVSAVFPRPSPSAAAQRRSFRRWQRSEMELNGSQPEHGAAGKPPSTTGMLRVLKVCRGSEGSWKHSQRERNAFRVADSREPTSNTANPKGTNQGGNESGEPSPFLPVHLPSTHAFLLLRAYP